MPRRARLMGNVTKRNVGKVIQRTTTDFTSEWVSMPYAISAPVQGSQWPARFGAFFGGGMQEYVGDSVKNAIKEQP